MVQILERLEKKLWFKIWDLEVEIRDEDMVFGDLDDGNGGKCV